MKKTIIGIVSKNLTLEEFFGWKFQRINDTVRYALCKNDAITIGILPQRKSQEFNNQDEHEENQMTDEEIQDLNTTLEMCDGFILQGGLTSHNYEEYIARYCYENDKPCLGICAGFNNIIRALGGTTSKVENENKHDRPDLKYAHTCKVIDKDSLYFKIVQSENFEVNSIHTYKAENISDELSVVAVSDDGQVEVVEAKSKKFFIGVKYHPELLVDFDEKQNNIFKVFIKSCKK